MSNRMPDPFTLVIFGASGDLTRRKLIPAVYGLFRDGLLPDEFSLIGYARSRMSDESFRVEMRDATSKFVRSGQFDKRTWEMFASRIHYHRGGRI